MHPEVIMTSPVAHRSSRWMLRRLERQAHRRAKAPSPVQPRLLAVASLVDGYCEILGPVANDDGLASSRRRPGPPLAVVRG